MPVAASEIERLILATFPDAKVEIQDLAGDNNPLGSDRRG